MKNLARICFVTVSALLSIGWADNWEAVRSAAADVRTVRAEFVQEKHMPFLVKPLVSKGVLFFEAPDSLRWEYVSPVRSVLTMYEGEVKRYVKDEQGLIEDAGAQMEAFQVVLREITGWFTGRFTENPYFDARFAPPAEIVLTPKAQGVTRMVHSIEIVLASAPGAIETVTIQEGESAVTKIRFENISINQPLPDGVFSQIP